MKSLSRNNNLTMKRGISERWWPFASLAGSIFPLLLLIAVGAGSHARGELAPPRFEEEAPACCRLDPDSMPGWHPLFDGESLGDWQPTNFGGQGGVDIDEGQIILPMGDALTGIHWNGAALPESEYEICFEAMRISGSDFFTGLTFPVGSSHATLIVGGWGGGLTGLSSIDSRDAGDNQTTRFRRFEDNRWYRIHLRVREDRIQAWLDEEVLVDLMTEGLSIDLRPGPIHLSRPLGVASFQTTAAVRDIKLRRLDGAAVFGGDKAASGEALPETDERAATAPRTRDTLRDFPSINSAAEWRERARKIREQVLVSNGLWPLPEKTPLNARVFGKTEHDGYSIEKVLLETYPGFYLAGNLYRPLNSGSGPFPGVLNPHGHWQDGRLTDTEIGSIPARCIQMARMGMVAFAYDMVGYADTVQVDHAFAGGPRPMLWNINLMGLQTWNSIRALDFLEALPDVDPSRLAATGASGGATQTFILAALDDRLSVVAPNVMVSHSMQGGSLCENAPGLRVKYSNMEIAAAAAPRPQILVASAQDWTRDTMTVEGPAVQSVYALMGVPNRLHSVIFDYPHNYNKTSREAVYGWFDAWLLNDGTAGRASFDPIPEMPYASPSVADLRDGLDSLPEDALGEEELIASLISTNRGVLEALYPDPDTAGSLSDFQETMLPAWRSTLLVEVPEEGEIIAEVGDAEREGNLWKREVTFGRSGKGDRISAILAGTDDQSEDSWVFVLAHAEGRDGFWDEEGTPTGLAKKLLDEGKRILIPELFPAKMSVDTENAGIEDYLQNHFTTYNRTELQERVQDLITAAAFALDRERAQQVAFVGVGRAGLWTLLAAPAADAVLADWDGFDSLDEDAYLARDIFTPGILKIGAFEGVAALAAPNPLYLTNTAGMFSAPRLQQAYQAAGSEDRLHVEEGSLSDAGLARWLSDLE